MLDFEVNDITNAKISEKKDYFIKKEEFFKVTFNNIWQEENKLIDESRENFLNFVLKWKNTKLNAFVQQLKEILNSEEFVDNSQRYSLIENLKADQIKIYNERINLVVEKLFKLPIEEISTRKYKDFNKEIDDIFNKAQSIYDMNTNKLVQNSEMIYKQSMNEIEKFKQRVKTLSYIFSSTDSKGLIKGDNFNNNNTMITSI